MSPIPFLSAILIFFTSATTSFASADDYNILSAYQVLQQYGFPQGLLPKGVTGYELNRDTGEFSAHWNGTCKFNLEGSYSLEYKSTISGIISKERLKNLKGVSVKVLFFWLNIVEVVRDGDELQFSVGIASANFPIDNFEESPQCGCGLNLLEGYDFPVGLLPNGVLGYKLDNFTGTFFAYLNGSCSFTVDSYELKYNPIIAGKITSNKLYYLSGIEVKIAFFWLKIVSVTRNNDELEFSVGFASANFDVSNFEESPTCGCGFDCVGYGNAAMKGTTKLSNRLVSFSSKNRKTRIETMSHTAILIAVAVAVVMLSQLVTSSPDVEDKRSAYEVLQDFDLPMGILPKGVNSYELDRSNGRFYAHFNGSCSFSLEGSYQLKYKSTISGYISKDKLTKLTGVSVKVLFLWLNIVEVVRDGNDLEFSVGLASASFSIDNFFECPQCGCGLNCNNGQVRKLKFNPSVSSI
ncbi:hypothetical protein F8388_007020 [Cannabis sativa]|nr:hypothetical protein F8388_007020 [Cannabis sativa]